MSAKYVLPIKLLCILVPLDRVESLALQVVVALQDRAAALNRERRNADVTQLDACDACKRHSRHAWFFNVTLTYTSSLKNPKSSRRKGLVVRAVPICARGPGFNPSSFQMFFFFLLVQGNKKAKDLAIKNCSLSVNSGKKSRA